jgi:hypothetical protein
MAGNLLSGSRSRGNRGTYLERYGVILGLFFFFATLMIHFFGWFYCAMMSVPLTLILALYQAEKDLSKND